MTKDYYLLDANVSGYGVDLSTGELKTLSNRVGYHVLPDDAGGREIISIQTKMFMSTGVTAIGFPRHLQEIGEAAFCNNYITELALPRNLYKLGKAAFSSNKIKTLRLPASLKVISERAFECNVLEHLKLPEGMEILEYMCFYNNPIKVLDLPRSIKHIDSNAFYESTKDMTIHAYPGSYGESFALEQGIPISYKDENGRITMSSIF